MTLRVRILLCVILGVITTIAVAWGAVAHLRSRRPADVMSLPMQMGMAAVQGRIIQLTRIEGFAYRGESWRVRDAEVGSTGGRKTAEEIQRLGGKAHLANLRASYERMAVELSLDISQSPKPNTASWIDNEAALGPPAGLLPDSIPPLGITGSIDDAGWPRRALRGLSRSWGEAGPPGPGGRPASFTARFEHEAVIEIPWRYSNPPAGPAWPTTLPLPVRVLWPGILFDAAFFATLWALPIFGPGLVRLGLRRLAGRCPRYGYDLSGSGGVPAGCPECGWQRK